MKQPNTFRQRIKIVSASPEVPHAVMIKFVKTSVVAAKTIAQTFAEIIKISESTR